MGGDGRITIMTARKIPVLPELHLRVRVPESVLMRNVGNEMVMLNLGNENYYGLNDVGALLMQCAEGGATLGEISQRLLTEFEVAPEELEADVRRVAGELLAAGLIEQEPL